MHKDFEPLRVLILQLKIQQVIHDFYLQRAEEACSNTVRELLYLRVEMLCYSEIMVYMKRKRKIFESVCRFVKNKMGEIAEKSRRHIPFAHLLADCLMSCHLKYATTFYSSTKPQIHLLKLNNN